ncbi:hypothetical protein GGF37_005352, partial [Kickxella alabastrina]
EPFGITQAVFGRFLRDVQKELVSDAGVHKRFREFTQGSDQEVMTAYEFEAYLLSAYNSVDGNLMTEDSECMDKECMDMDLPLNQYYISTSHNTYLASDQLVGESTVEGYVHALLRGCRCIELDSWDGRGGEPVVCHGHTLTTRILFEDVVIAISHYAFAVSPYPVILSLETHCSLPQQARMATILKKHLGEMLVQAPINGENECVLPSPNQLKYRIIIKNKVLESPNSRSPSLASSQPIAAVMAAATTAAPASATIAAAQSSTKTVSPRSSVAQLKRKVAPELSQLIVYCKAVHFEGFEEGSPEPVFDQVTSVSESAAIQLMRQYPRQYTHYNAMQMTRVYPSFSRFTSTNYNPISHWAAGSQLVAMNFQTCDRHMQIYEAMFRRTGGLGYVLKPRHLREGIPSLMTATVAERARLETIAESETPLSTSLSFTPLPPTSIRPHVRALNNSGGGVGISSNGGVASPSFARRTTVHINIISAHGALPGCPSRRQSMAVNTQPAYKVLSRPPSGVAMFSSDTLGFSALNTGNGGLPTTPPPLTMMQMPTNSTLNAAAAAAAAAALASAAAYAGQQTTSNSSIGIGGISNSSSNSRIRVEIEWIPEPSGLNGSSSSSSSVEDITALSSSTIGHPPPISHTRANSLYDTLPNSPGIFYAQPPGTGATATSFPFFSSTGQSSMAGTPVTGPILAPAPTPLANAVSFDQTSTKSRCLTGQ